MAPAQKEIKGLFLFTPIFFNLQILLCIFTKYNRFQDELIFFLFYADEVQIQIKKKLKKENFPILCQLFHFLHNKQFNKKLTQEKSKYIQAIFF